MSARRQKWPIAVGNCEVEPEYFNPPPDVQGQRLNRYARVHINACDSLTAAEARKLAAALLKAADKVDAMRGRKAGA